MNAGTHIKAPRRLTNWLQPPRLAYSTRMNKQIVMPYLTGTQGGGIRFHLPVDPLLSSGPSLPLLGSLVEDEPSHTSTSGSSTVINKGLPPIPTKLVERIRKWECVDLAQLLDDYRQPEGYTLQPSTGEQILVIDQDQVQHCRKQITDIFTWLKAFSRYMAVLTSCDSTTSAQTTGLVAHLHLILQLSQELGPQWMKYDIDYRQWAAARNVRQWGELKFTIYGHCLSAQQRFSGTSSHPRPTQAPGNRKSSNPNSKEACFRWNFRGRCDRASCPYSHSCWLCGGPHSASPCSTAPKRSK